MADTLMTTSELLGNLITIIEELATGYADEYGVSYTSPDDATRWALEHDPTLLRAYEKAMCFRRDLIGEVAP